MAQYKGSALKCGIAVQRSTSCAICRAANVMFIHGTNIAGVVDRASLDRPASPTRTRPPLGSEVCASRIASCRVGKTLGQPWPCTENDHGSPPDCCQISACITLGSTVSAQAVTSVRRSIGVHSDHTLNVDPPTKRMPQCLVL